jgi:hypothetical protein
MKLNYGEKEKLILNLLETKGVAMTAREIAEAIYGKGQHQSTVFSKLEEMVQLRKLRKVGAIQPFSYEIPVTDHIIPRFSEPDITSRLFNASNKIFDAHELFEKSNKYYSTIRCDSHARYLSWEHCYSYFYENRVNPTAKIRDFACLHLAWYLASWGMLRNSFLMQKDYLIHMDVIDLIFSKEYSSLSGIILDNNINKTETYLDSVFSLAGKIREAYTPFAKECNSEVTDTLITKVLLGTLGCVPAYDRFFKTGLRITGIASQSFTKESLRSLVGFYNANNALYGEFSFEINRKIKYPSMKIIDMCFWQIGYETSEDKSI